MNIDWYVGSMVKLKEKHIAKAFIDGAKRHGHRCNIRDFATTGVRENDLVCMFGVKSKEKFNKIKCNKLMFDKGYDRTKFKSMWKYVRISLNAHHPTNTTMYTIDYPSDRFDKLGWELKPWKTRDDVFSHILFIASSAKYHNWYNLPEPTAYAKNVITEIRKHTDAPIIYRPKPSWREAVPIDGTIFSRKKNAINQDLKKSFIAITHGSNGCVESLLTGTPVITIGDGIAKPITSTNISDLNSPMKGDREKFFNALAYHQWTIEEMRSGECWETVKEWLNL